MKRLILAIICICALVGCKSTEEEFKAPSQFETTNEKYHVPGCETLKRDIAIWNKNNPDKKKKVADC